ncbi:MAG: glycosyltransferase [Chitinophagaceae bacterium]|nr:glycosyltransferase [Chitinophagaceae bacterium]
MLSENSKIKKEIILITGSYPYSFAGENTFIPQEIEVYKSYFDKISIIPKNTKGNIHNILDKNIKVNVNYSNFLNKKLFKLVFLFSLIFDKLIYKELCLEHRKWLKLPTIILKIIKSRVYTKMTTYWFNKNYKKSKNIIFLTWWFDESTYGILSAKKLKNSKIFTRAHGYDYYLERHELNYLPFRKYYLKKQITIFVASMTGAIYLKKTYPQYNHKFKFSILGIEDPKVINSPSQNKNEFNIISCSFLNDVKRIDLIFDTVLKLGDLKPNYKITWTHVGDGIKIEYFKSRVHEIKQKNVIILFLNYPGKDGLIKLYRDNPYDLFINLSLSEGGNPVSIMEAMSVGIPILATSVGGNNEIVSDKNGKLVSVYDDSTSISQTIDEFFILSNQSQKYRSESRKLWEEKYNAKVNYALFCKSILN